MSLGEYLHPERVTTQKEQWVFDDKTPTLEELGISFMDPAEGLLEYNTITGTLQHWENTTRNVNPTHRGADVKMILNEYWGISPELAESCPALTEYWKQVKEGRFISMVAMQFNNPTPYFLTNVLQAAQIFHASDGKMPVSLMVMEYPDDMFSFKNGDKTGALFGDIQIPYVDESGSVQIFNMDVTPDAVIKPYDADLRSGQEIIGDAGVGHIVRTKEPVLIDGTISNKQRAKYQKQFSGKPCEDLLLPVDAELYKALNITVEDQYTTSEGNYVRSTDFYRALWQTSLNNLRQQGVIPSEEDLPIFYVDVRSLYTYMADNAKPSPDFLRLHDWDSLPRRSDGMMGGEAYYLIQPRWADMYIECSSCMCVNDPKYGAALPINDSMRANLGVKPTEVRLPDHELSHAKVEELTILDYRVLPLEYKSYMKQLYEELMSFPNQELFNRLGE